MTFAAMRTPTVSSVGASPPPLPSPRRRQRNYMSTHLPSTNAQQPHTHTYTHTRWLTNSPPGPTVAAGVNSVRGRRIFATRTCRTLRASRRDDKQRRPAGRPTLTSTERRERVENYPTSLPSPPPPLSCSPSRQAEFWARVQAIARSESETSIAAAKLVTPILSRHSVFTNAFFPLSFELFCAQPLTNRICSPSAAVNRFAGDDDDRHAFDIVSVGTCERLSAAGDLRTRSEAEAIRIPRVLLGASNSPRGQR